MEEFKEQEGSLRLGITVFTIFIIVSLAGWYQIGQVLFSIFRKIVY